jgi:hypothetical protein
MTDINIGGAMASPIGKNAQLPADTVEGFNFNKLQAAACMVASALVSIAVIAFVIKAVF